MKPFTITSDGNVDIDFQHVVENPLDQRHRDHRQRCRRRRAPPADDTVIDRDFDGSTVTASSTVANGGQDWSSARGAFMIEQHALHRLVRRHAQGPHLQRHDASARRRTSTSTG